VLAAAWRIGGRTLHHPILWTIAVAAFVALFAFSVPFPLVILVAALAAPRSARSARGIPRRQPRRKEPGAQRRGDRRRHPDPEHARFSARRFAMKAVVFIALWAVALGLLSRPGARRSSRRWAGSSPGGAAHLRRRLRGAALCGGNRGRQRVGHGGANDRTDSRSGRRRRDRSS
jgi:hypothetical protein